MKTSSTLFFPRASSLFSESTPKLIEFNRVSNQDSDGYHRFDIDFYETTEWSMNLLERMSLMKQEPPTPFTLKPHCFQSRHEFRFDFSKPPSKLKPVFLHVNVKKLRMNETEKKRLAVIAGESYSENHGIVSVECKRESASHQTNILQLSRLFLGLVDSAKVIFINHNDILT